MANIFKNPFVLAETIIGSIYDDRNVILWEQPAIDNSQVLSASNGMLTANDKLVDMIKKSQLKELFVGLGDKYISKINGWNAYGISYLSAKVSPTSDLCEHPIESGGIITDNAIINPLRATVEISMPTIFYTRIHEQIQKMYKEKTRIILQTKFGFYKNLVLVGIPYVLNHKDVDRTPITLDLQQVIEVTPTYVTNESGTAINDALNPSDNDTKDLGTKKPTESTYESLAAIGYKG